MRIKPIRLLAQGTKAFFCVGSDGADTWPKVSIVIGQRRSPSSASGKSHP